MDLRTGLTLCRVRVNRMPPKDRGWRAMAVGTESQAMAGQACGKRGGMLQPLAPLRGLVLPHQKGQCGVLVSVQIPGPDAWDWIPVPAAASCDLR